jgi:hypothetical protein
MSSIFLSHHYKDKRFARRLGEALASHGVRAWIDEAEIKAGDSLLRKITEGIKDMEFLGVILTPNSVSSTWVQKEVEIATTMEIQQKKVKVIPILYKDCEIPIFLQDKLYADFRNRAMFQHSLIKLLDAVIPEGFKEQILSVVINGIQAEFAAYKSLPKIKMNKVDKCFTKTGSARKRIVHLLKRHEKRRWVINNQLNPSTYELLEIKLNKLEENRSIVSTEEYWYLRWFDLNEFSYMNIYNEKNKQTYILVKDKGKWKIDANIYPRPKAKVGYKRVKKGQSFF